MGPAVTRITLWVPLVVLGTGCEVPPTQLLVVVNTDLAVPAEVDEVRIRVWGPGQEMPREDRLLSLTGAQVTLPASFGVAPLEGDPDRRVTVTADGRLGGAPIVTTSARSTFIEQKILRLDLFLARGCRDVTCPDDETCRGGGCEPVEVDPGRLPRYDPGEDLGPLPPDEPPGLTILLPFDAATQLRNLDMDVAPDGGVVLVGSFQGTITLGLPATSSRWAGFLARYEPDGTPRYVQILTATNEDAFLYAVTVGPDDTTWVASGCTGGGLEFATIEGTLVRGWPCGVPTRIDWPLDANGDLVDDATVEWGVRDPVRARVDIDAAGPRVASFHWESGGGGPTFARAVGLAQPELCSLPGGLAPAALALDEAGTLHVAGAFDGNITSLGLEAVGRTDRFLLEISEMVGCTVPQADGGGTAGVDEGLGIARSADAWAMVGRVDTTNGFVLAGAGAPILLGGPGDEVLSGVAATGDGGWVAVGLSSLGADLEGEPIDSLGGPDAIVLGLDEQLGLVWQRALGGAGGDAALRVEIDPTSGGVIVLGLTTGPSLLDPAGALQDGQTAIFVHRLTPP